MKKVCIVFGGISCEHEVSRISAVNVLKNLDKTKYIPIPMEISKENKYFIYDYKDEDFFYQEILNISNTLSKEQIVLDLEFFKRNNISVVFPVLHGTQGEDGKIQGFLELSDTAYVGCDVLSSAVCMDKIIAKDVLSKNNIAVADYLWYTVDEIKADVKAIIKEVEQHFAYPVFIKPSELGSSVGISKAKNSEDLVKALQYASSYSRKILVEEFVEGMELEVAVLGSYEDIQSSSVGQIVSSSEFYDYNAKYIDGKSQTILHPDISSSSEREIKSIAERTFKILGCYGMARVDFFLTKGKKAIVNEINTIPGFTGISMYPMLWGQIGLSYTKLLDKLIQLALDRKEKYVFDTDYKG